MRDYQTKYYLFSFNYFKDFLIHEYKKIWKRVGGKKPEREEGPTLASTKSCFFVFPLPSKPPLPLTDRFGGFRILDDQWQVYLSSVATVELSWNPWRKPRNTLSSPPIPTSLSPPRPSSTLSALFVPSPADLKLYAFILFSFSLLIFFLNWGIGLVAEKVWGKVNF